VLVVAPRRSICLELISDLQCLASGTGVSVDALSGQDTLKPPKGKSIRVITAANLLSVMTHWDPRIPLTGLELVVCENLEQLNSVYELGISILRHATQTVPTRYVGFSSSLNDPTDLAAWLHVNPLALHSFQPKDRDQSLTVTTQMFSIPLSPALFRAMAKPAHAAIQNTPAGESAIIFVPSRMHCQLVAQDLITECTLQTETEKAYLPTSIAGGHIDDYLVRLQSRSLIDSVSHGVGIYHDGMPNADRNTILELYVEGLIRMLIVSRDSCWTLPVKAPVVVVMGTQYLDLALESAGHQLTDYSLTELLRMQSRAVRHSGSGHFHLFCPTEANDTLIRFLNDGLPLESELLKSNHLQSWFTSVRRREGGVIGKQQAVETLSLTFLAHRIISNPFYYDMSSISRSDALSRIIDKLDEVT
jgi:antiviral helicase SLH1